MNESESVQLIKTRAKRNLANESEHILRNWKTFQLQNDRAHTAVIIFAESHNVIKNNTATRINAFPGLER